MFNPTKCAAQVTSIPQSWMRWDISLGELGEVVLEALPEAAVTAFPGMKKYLPIF